MSLILEALKKAKQMAQGENTPPGAQTLVKSFGFTQPSKKTQARRMLLMYVVPALVLAVVIVAGAKFWSSRQPKSSMALSRISAAVPAASVSPPPVVTPDSAPADNTPPSQKTEDAPKPVPVPPATPAVKASTLPAPVKSVPAPAVPVRRARAPQPLAPTPSASGPTAPPPAVAPIPTATASTELDIGNQDPFEVGNFYFKTGEYDKAIQLYNRVLKKNQLDYSVWNNIGLADLALSRNGDAIKAFTSAITIKQDYDKAHNNLGTALMADGRNAEAESQFRRALELNSKNTEALINLGRVERSFGKLDQAKSYYLKALLIDPSNPIAHYNIAQLFELQGEKGDAVDHYRSFVNSAGLQYSTMIPEVQRKIQELSPIQP